mgnify:CR=1 FL=1
MRGRGLLVAAVGLWLAAFARDGVDRWIDATVLPPLSPAISQEVVDRNGVLLRAYTVDEGRWRLGVDGGQVDPFFIALLLDYEDKRFYQLLWLGLLLWLVCAALVPALQAEVERVHVLHRQDLARGAGEVVAEVPVLGAAPDQLRRFVRERQAFAPARRGLAQPGQAIDIGLLGGDLARHQVLRDRIGSRRAERNAVELRHPHHVAHGVAEPVGMVALEEIGLAYRERIDRTQVDRNVMARRERAVPGNTQVTVGRAEGPVEVDR